MPVAAAAASSSRARDGGPVALDAVQHVVGPSDSIQLVRRHQYERRNVEAHRYERLAIKLSRTSTGGPALVGNLHYEQSHGEEQLEITINDGNQLAIRRTRPADKYVLSFRQSPRQQLASSSKSGGAGGGGVVADSDPAAEYIEIVNKAGALFKAVEIASRF